MGHVAQDPLRSRAKGSAAVRDAEAFSQIVEQMLRFRRNAFAIEQSFANLASTASITTRPNILYSAPLLSRPIEL
jgi:hypothetical protein